MSKQSFIGLRERVPVRSNVTIAGGYRNHKGELRNDFNRRCGYCDSADSYFGGASGAHIDHFAPKSRFPTLTHEYRNLVYACPFCNRAKSNKWVSDDPNVSDDGSQGFTDPCSDRLDEHLTRRTTGEIVAVTGLGEYMIRALKLQLLRHRFIWQAQKLDSIVDRLLILKPAVQKANPLYAELLEAITEVVEAYRAYRDRVHDS